MRKERITGGRTERPERRREKARVGRSAFTLVELLVVMGIIVLLAGMITVAGGYMWGEALKSRTKGTITMMAMALNQYGETYGGFPHHDQLPFRYDDDNDAYDIRGLYFLLRDRDLLKEPVNSRFREDPSSDGEERNDRVLDAWKNPLAYRFPRQVQDGQFDLWSMGPDELDSRGTNKSSTIDPTSEDAAGTNADNIVYGKFRD